MITIKTLEKAKKITKSLFDFSKTDKVNLSKFRTLFAKELQLNELQDAFKAEDNKHRDFILNQYISFFDDPRVTIEVAREIQDDIDKAESYFNEHFKNSDGILFPINSYNELLTRCEEILIIFNEIDWFSIQNLFNSIIKISFEKSRVAYIFPDMGKYGNPELIAAIEVIKMFKNSSGSKFFERMIDYDHENDFNPVTGFYELYQKTLLVTRAMVFSQCNGGRYMNDKVTSKNNKIKENMKNKKLKAKELKAKNIEILFSNCP
jgi:hypothetical protein